MAIRWIHLLIPVACAGLAWAEVSVAFWESAKPSLMVALSVIAAGVLLRLARGLPFTNPDHFEISEARKIAAAMRSSARALRALIFAVFTTMMALVFAPSIALSLNRFLENHPDLQSYILPATSALIAFLLTYVFVRIATVIQGDIALIDMQSKLLENAVAQKQGKRFEEMLASNESPPIRNPEGYGKIMQ